jgi:hypothetical protein
MNRQSRLRPCGRRASLPFLALILSTALVGCDSSQDPVAPEPAEEAIDLLTIFEITLQDEYRAEAVYLGVMEDFGDALPFRNIAKAEAQHARNILALYEARGVAAAANEWSTSVVPHFASLQAACQAGVVAEVENIEMYDEILLMELPDDVLQAVTRNRRASVQAHLPAFQNCS